MDNYTRSWIRIIKLAKLFRFLPWNLYKWIGCFLGKYFSFLHCHKQNLIYNLENGLGLCKTIAKKEFLLNCKSSGVAICMIEKLSTVSLSWLSKNINVNSQELLDELKQNGGIIFTHHSFHHNLLMSYFKSIGKKGYPVVNPPTSFSNDDFLYVWTIALNESTQTNLAGGKMLYVDNKKKLFEDMNHALNEKSILIILCDFNSNANNSKTYSFFGKNLNIPIGALKYAEQKEVGVYFAGFRWCPKGNYELDLITMNKDFNGYADNYMHHLETYLRKHPYSWQNWEHL